MGEKSDERIALETRAQALDVSFAANIGDAKLAERVAAAEAAKTGQPAQDKAPPPAPTSDTPAQAGARDSAPAASPSASLTRRIVVEVIGPKRGRGRIRRRFGPTPVLIPIEELTEDDQAALIADPKLTVTAREID
ncbi:hypothetical protein LA6_003433 [Marinibacterium anthonyi]|nr:hypothetical protein LA6_003433 [Marinibacterium anthonyi]